MTNKFMYFILCLLMCSSCNSDSKCELEDSAGECCIDESDCGTTYDSIDSNSKVLQEACLKLGSHKKPMLCSSDFNGSEFATCVKLDQKRACRSGYDLLTGEKATVYEVYCCE